MPRKNRMEHYFSMMKEARELLGGICVRCGETENLQFDHVDPGTKIFAISHGTSKSAAKFWAEVAKCQLLCDPHHKEKTEAECSNRGESHGLSKLRELDVRYIRELHKLGHSDAKIAEEFPVSRHVIYLARTGKTWKHVK